MSRFSPPAGITAVKSVKRKGKNKKSPSFFYLKGVNTLSLSKLRDISSVTFKKNAIGQHYISLYIFLCLVLPNVTKSGVKKKEGNTK